MRMDFKNNKLTAKEIINNYSEKDLNIFIIMVRKETLGRLLDK